MELRMKAKFKRSEAFDWCVAGLKASPVTGDPSKFACELRWFTGPAKQHNPGEVIDPLYGYESLPRNFVVSGANMSSLAGDIEQHLKTVLSDYERIIVTSNDESDGE